MPSTEEQKKVYKEQKEILDIWKELADDNTLTEQEAAVAELMKDNFVDITNLDDFRLFMTKNPETGEYTPIKFVRFAELTKGNAHTFIGQFLAAVKKYGVVYDFNEMKKDGAVHSVELSGSAGFKHNFIRHNNLEAPEPVSKPGWFKNITNKWFGWFNSDITRYNKYAEAKAVYDGKVADKAKIDQAKEPYKNRIEEAKNLYKDYKTVKTEIAGQRTIEDRLQEKADLEKRSNKVIEVVSGRSKEYIGHHENYHKIVEIPIKPSDKLPIAGLAILAACTVEANKNVRDASTQADLVLIGDHKPSPEEQETLNALDKANNISNVGGKILESVLGGADIQRMGNRMEAVVASREILNNAIEQYNANNRQPLADLINDSLAAVYNHAASLGVKTNTPSARAVSEISEALTELFNNDPELRKMVDFPEFKLTELRGAAKAYRMLENTAEKQYQACLLDEGPNSPKREELLGDLLFGGVLHDLIDKQVQGIRRATDKENEKEMTTEKFSSLMANYPDGGDQANLYKAITNFLNEKNLRLPELFTDMARPDFDTDKFKKDTISEIKKTETFKQLMALPKEELFKKDMMNLGETILRESAISYGKKIESVQVQKEQEQLQAGKNDKEGPVMANENAKTQVNPVAGLS